MTNYGLKAQLLYQKHFPKFGPNIITSCVYTFNSDSNYVIETGAVSAELTPISQPLNIIFVDFDSEKIDDNSILHIDKIAIFPRLNILDNSMILEIDDSIVEDLTGKEWIVKKVKLDPALAGYELHVRPRLSL